MAAAGIDSPIVHGELTGPFQTQAAVAASDEYTGHGALLLEFNMAEEDYGLFRAAMMKTVLRYRRRMIDWKYAAMNVSALRQSVTLT
jgi:hypothetical protein